MPREKFWMVLGDGQPNYRHTSKQSAKTEAERLARQNPGVAFTVLESMATAVRREIQWEENEARPEIDDDDVPF